jgi:hypothetical protein
MSKVSKLKEVLYNDVVVLTAAAGTSTVSMDDIISSLDASKNINMSMFGGFTVVICGKVVSGSATGIAFTMTCTKKYKVVDPDAPTAKSVSGENVTTLGTVTVEAMTNTGVATILTSNELPAGSYDDFKLILNGGSGTYSINVSVKVIGIPL